MTLSCKGMSLPTCASYIMWRITPRHRAYMHPDLLTRFLAECPSTRYRSHDYTWEFHYTFIGCVIDTRMTDRDVVLVGGFQLEAFEFIDVGTEISKEYPLRRIKSST